MKKLLLLTVVISLATLAGFWGVRQSCSLCSLGGSNRKIWSTQNLDLSPSQRTWLRGIETGFRKQADEICMKICSGRMEVVKLMSDPAADPAVLHRKIEEIGALQILLEKRIADHILEVKKGLDREQSEIYLNRIRQTLYESIKQMGYRDILGKV